MVILLYSGKCRSCNNLETLGNVYECNTEGFTYEKHFVLPGLHDGLILLTRELYILQVNQS